jgi:hypothetical protein
LTEGPTTAEPQRDLLDKVSRDGRGRCCAKVE